MFEDIIKKKKVGLLWEITLPARYYRNHYVQNIVYICLILCAFSNVVRTHKNPQSVDKSGFHLLFRNCILVWGIYISVMNTFYEKENCS